MKRTIAAIMALTLITGATVGTGFIGTDLIAPISASAAETQASYAGRYTVDLKLMQYMSTDASMGNNAFEQSGVLVVNEDKTATLEIDLHSLQYLGRDGYLGWMKRVTKVNTYNKYGAPTDYETVDAEILDVHEGVYDVFNDPDSSSVDENVAGKWYPKKLSIPVEVEIDDEGNVKAVEDEYSESLFLVQVYVPVMESITTGGGTKFANVQVFNSTLKKVATPTLSGNSATISGDITLNSYINVDERISSDKDAKIVTILPNGATEETPISEVLTSDECKLSADIPAKDMTADVVYRVVGGDGKNLGEVTTSVAEYAQNLINSTDSSVTSEQKAFAKAMLNYGGYAQEYFGKNTDNLANASLSDTDKSLTSVTSSALTSFKAAKSGSISGLTYSGSCLILEGTTKVSHYFKLSSGQKISDYAFQVNGKTVNAVQDGDFYVITTDGIGAANLDDNYAVVVTKGSATFTLNYSVLSYCESALRTSEKTTLQNVSKALYLYNKAAENL